MSNEQVCQSCRQIITDDESGLCLDCQTGVLSQRPGSITAEQRAAIGGLCVDQRLWTRGRAELIGTVVPGWAYGGDLDCLSQQQAGDVLELLEERRRRR
jgi:hypothetical protein